MRVLTLNIRHGGGTRGKALVAFLAEQSPDVIVLTEYRQNATGQAILTLLTHHGYRYQATAARDAKLNSVCIASRVAFSPLVIDGGANHEPQRVLTVQFERLALSGVYFPLNEAKRPVFQWLKTSVLPRLGKHGLIIGDFNTGKAFEDEVGNTFACTDCFDELLASGLIDSWRRRNPTGKEFSWYSRGNNGFRIDHALATQAFDETIQSIAYSQEPRLSGITDHSALVVQSDG